MGKFARADQTQECHNCGRVVGRENLVTNHDFCWPVCEDCDHELTQATLLEEEESGYA